MYCTFFRRLRWYKKTVIVARRFFDDFFCDFSIFTKRRDPWEFVQFTIGFPIVNSLNYVGSCEFMKIEKSQKKSSKNLRATITVFLYHLKRLKNVHSFLQLEVSKIKICHRFGLAPGNSYPRRNFPNQPNILVVDFWHVTFGENDDFVMFRALVYVGASRLGSLKSCLMHLPGWY